MEYCEVRIMGRKDTFNNLDDNTNNNTLDRFSKFTMDEVSEEIQPQSDQIKEKASPTKELTPDNPEIDVTDQYQEEPKKEAPQQEPLINLFKKKRPSVQRSWKAWPEVDDALNDIFRDKKGKLRPGAKGEITTLMNNAVISELIRIGYYPPEKENDRTDYEGW